MNKITIEIDDKDLLTDDQYEILNTLVADAIKFARLRTSTTSSAIADLKEIETKLSLLQQAIGKVFK